MYIIHNYYGYIINCNVIICTFVGSLHSIISHDPSFESRQPKCARKTFHPRRRMIVNPAEVGIEDTDGGVEEVDGGDGNELMFEMEVVVRDDHNEDELVSGEREGSTFDCLYIGTGYTTGIR